MILSHLLDSDVGRFQHSGETMHRYFHIFLIAILEFSIEIIKPLSYDSIPEFIWHKHPILSILYSNKHILFHLFILLFIIFISFRSIKNSNFFRVASRQSMAKLLVQLLSSINKFPIGKEERKSAHRILRLLAH